MSYGPVNDSAAIETQVDGKSNTTSYAEDALGRVASVTDALNRVTTYTYDATGAVLTATDPQNQVTTNAYDAAGALTSTTYSNAATHSAVRAYSAAGLPATLVDGTGTTTFTYDSLGRLTNQTAPGGSVGYGYNLRSQVTTMTYPNNKVVTRGYENDGALVTSTDWSSKKTTFTYDQNESWTGNVDPNGVTTTTGYDNPGRAVTTMIKKGTTTLGALTYTQDAASQITKETSTSMGATRTFTVDTVGRVTAENTVVYAYDAADQLTTNGATTQGYDTAGQLTTAVAGATSTAFTFDARGNRATATTGATVATYGYDQANRLTTYARGATTASYAYNGDGLRASKTVAGVTTKFVYDTAEGMPLILTDGKSYYLYGPGGVPYAQITTAGVVTYLHTDQLGSVRMITSATGASVGTANFTAYGTGTTTGTTSPFGYAGQYTDTESGLQWMRARYYDPTTAQFLTVDPLAAATGTRYSYASGNPITMADPTGLCSWYDLACDVSAMTREQLPDFVNLNVGIVFPIGELPIGIGGGWNVTVTRDGHVYTGPEVVAGVAGLSASLEGGWIDNCSVPTSDQLDQFVNGFGLTADGYVPVAAGLGPAGGKTWGNEGGGKPSDTSTNFGVGMGVGRWLSVSQGYNWRTGAKGEGW